MIQLKRNVLAMALASIGVCAHGAAQAQVTPPASAAHATAANQSTAVAKNGKLKQTKQEETLAKKLSTITVTGYTSVVESSLDIQRYSPAIVAVVNSKDINGLPQQSIADALSSLPAVAVERGAGQASQIDIRGLNGNFIATTLNGVSQSSTSGSNYLQYDIYPAELINQAKVYYSSQANLIPGGVGGTIALQTANPLDISKPYQFNLDVRGSWNDRAGNVYSASPWGWRISGAFQGKFFHNTLGVGLGFAQMYQPHVSERFMGLAYANSTESVGNGQQAYVPEGFSMRQQGGEERRNGYLGTIVWKPAENFEVRGDVLYSKFYNGSNSYGFRVHQLDYGQATITNPVILPSGALIGGTASTNNPANAFSIETTAHNFTDSSSILSADLGAKWQIGNWILMPQLSYSHAITNSLNIDTTADPYSNCATSSASCVLMNQSATFLYNGLSIPQNISFANSSIYTNLNDLRLTRYGMYPYLYQDKKPAFRFDAKYMLNNNPFLSSIRLGIYLENHKYQPSRRVYVYGNEWNQYQYASAPNNSEYPLTIPTGDATQVCWSGQFSGMPCFMAINFAGVLAAHGITPNPIIDPNYGYTIVQSNEVNSRARDAYVMGDIDTELFGQEMTGNVGLRFAHTFVYSKGFQQVCFQNTFACYAPDYQSHAYSKLLPSLNLVYHLSGGNQLRFAAAKVFARPPIDQLQAGRGAYVYPANTYNIYGGTSPALDPLTTVQFDLGFWHYFSDSSGQVYVDLFHKHIDSFVENINITPYDFQGAGIPVPINPATGVPYLDGTYQTAYNNTKGGSFKGIEVGITKIHFLPGIWSGLGFGVDITKTLSNVTNISNLGGPGMPQTFPGLSRYVSSGQIFYDTNRLSARLSVTHRTSFVTSYQLAVNYQQVYAAPETVWNFQTSYRLTKNLTLLFQGLNLSDAPSQTYYSSPAEPGTLQYFGRTYYAGFNYNL